MTAVNIAEGATPTVILAAPTTPWKVCHIYNASNVTVYIQFDNDTPTLATTNGWPIPSEGSFTLENTGSIQAYRFAIKGIHGASGNKEVRTQVIT